MLQRFFRVSGLSARAWLIASIWLVVNTTFAQPPVRNTGTPGAVPPALIPDLTVAELMKDTINPSAQALWKAVSYVATEAGTTETEPRTDADWAALRKHADVLVRAGSLLILPTLKIAKDQARTPAYQYTPVEIEQLRQQGLSSWREYSQRLQTTTQKLIGAIEKHDLPAYIELGAPINQACEGCHAQFWYRQ
jgi:hypothetical protein